MPALRKNILIGISAALMFLVMPALEAQASDPEYCLSCHRYKGMARVDDAGETIRLFYIDPSLYEHNLGPHARLACTGCHPREEVGVIPHRNVSYVDCTKTCHITSPTNHKVYFSHDHLEDTLKKSAHPPDALDTCNNLLGEPLAPGQSRCLLCHDDPTFGWNDQTWAHQRAFVDRCNTCHSKDLPIDTQYFFFHVHARSRRAQSGEDTVSQCTLCHSNKQIRKQFKIPDSGASYLVSFHGKAMQLGSQETAGCLDCHVGEGQNAHMMLGHTKEEASTHDTKLATTCRSTECHPEAGKLVSSAAVHLDLATSGGIEFLIGCIFFVLILTTFGPSVGMQTLELLQIVVGRHEPAHHDRLHRTEKLMATPEGRRALRRFTRSQQFQHWNLALCFSILVLTGFPIKFADHAWAAWLIDAMGGVTVARVLHRWFGAVLLLSLLYHLVYIALYVIREKRKTGNSWFSCVYGLPILTNHHDLIALPKLIGYLLFLKKERPEGVRFSMKEKFEYFGVIWGTFLLGFTGVLMWANAEASRYLPGRLLTFANLLHTFEAFLALLHVGVLHMIGVIFSPAVFPVSKAMFTGDTPAEEIAEAHSLMIAEAEEKLGHHRTGAVGTEALHDRTAPLMAGAVETPQPGRTGVAKYAGATFGIIRKYLVRIYTLGLMLLVLGAGYSAVHYLLFSIFFPTKVPDRYMNWPTELAYEALLEEENSVNDSKPGRAPLGHYHRVGRWFQPEIKKGCITDGCHGPLPHNKGIETRAFANSHTQFMACELCHTADITDPVEAVWLSTETGLPQKAPAVLRLRSFLEIMEKSIDEEPAAIHRPLLELTEKTLAVTGNHPVLAYLHRSINTSEPGSPVWNRSVKQLQEELPLHARGEYGAKLALSRSVEERTGLLHGLHEQTADYLQTPPDSEEGKGIIKEIHTDVLAKPGTCFACHGSDPGRLNYDLLGYPSAQVQTLNSTLIAKQMQNIRDGLPFYLPYLMDGF